MYIEVSSCVAVLHSNQFCWRIIWADNAVRTMITAVVCRYKQSPLFIQRIRKTFCSFPKKRKTFPILTTKISYLGCFRKQTAKMQSSWRKISYYGKLMCSGLDRYSALVKLTLSETTATRAEKFSYLQKVLEPGKMQSFKDFLRWFSNKDVVLTLEAMEKMVQFYH